MSDRRMTIHFVDGTRLSLMFPQQTSDSSSIASRIQDALKGQYLMVEVDGSLMLFPFTNIKYVQTHPAPSPVPANVIQGAKLVD